MKNKELGRCFVPYANHKARMQKLFIFFSFLVVSCNVCAFDKEPELLKFGSMGFKNSPKLLPDNFGTGGVTFDTSEPSQLRGESGAELGGGISFRDQTIIELSAKKTNKPADNSANQSGDNGKDCTVQEIISVIVGLIAMLIFGIIGAWYGANQPVTSSRAYEPNNN